MLDNGYDTLRGQEDRMTWRRVSNLLYSRQLKKKSLVKNITNLQSVQTSYFNLSLDAVHISLREFELC